MSKMAEAFSFGGGYKNGGLSEDAMELLRPVFSFDYMGAAEFEWGAVPESLSQIAEWGQAEELTTDQFTVPLSDVPVPFTLEPSEESEATIYLLAHKAMIEEVTERVKNWSTSPAYGEDAPSFKESPKLGYALHRQDELSDPIGWLELDNHFMFFSKKDTWENVCTLFGVETS